VLRADPSTLLRSPDLNEPAERRTYREDGDLAAGLSRRDPLAMEVLYDRLGRQAFGLAYRILGDGPAAEDVVQEAFLTVWRQADRIDAARGKLSSFVLTVVHHKAIDALRVKRGQVARQVPTDVADIEKSGADVSERVIQSLNRDEVRTALSAVPDDQRRAIEMAYYEGLTHLEIAEALRLPLGTVKSRLRLGLEKMRSALKSGSGDELRRS
jgi:RNA polymerase sigma-70 factor, ECF subfamily